MYFNDHAPPHFHAQYGDNEAVYVIETLETMRGELPRHAHSMVVEWATLYRQDLWSNWEKARLQRPLDAIDPLE
jgi:hypothetical protein